MPPYVGDASLCASLCPSPDKQSAAGVPSRVMRPLRRLWHLCHPFSTGRQKKERKEELRPYARVHQGSGAGTRQTHQHLHLAWHFECWSSVPPESVVPGWAEERAGRAACVEWWGRLEA